MKPSSPWQKSTSVEIAGETACATNADRPFTKQGGAGIQPAGFLPRTVSPYIKRQTVDSTLHTTSSMLRTTELLLGPPPIGQYDAAASPMYAAFGDTPDLTPFVHMKTLRAYSADSPVPGPVHRVRFSGRAAQ